jgi:hypothetical protein
MTRGRAPSPAHSGAHRRGRRLEYLTVGCNAIEALVSVSAGLAAGSTALIGFGVDSAIESTSGVALLWRLHEEGDGRERLALRLVGASFLLLALYVAFEPGALCWDANRTPWPRW